MRRIGTLSNRQPLQGERIPVEIAPGKITKPEMKALLPITFWIKSGRRIVFPYIVETSKQLTIIATVNCL